MTKTVLQAKEESTKHLKRVGDYAPKSRWPDRQKLAMEDARSVSSSIEGIETRAGEQGSYLVIGVHTDDTLYVVVTGSAAVCQILKEIEQKRGFPVLGTFSQQLSKSGRSYYTLS